jgi:hypothetical protein
VRLICFILSFHLEFIKVIPKRQSKNGTSIIELCCALLFAIPVFLIVFDFAMFAVGSQFNDKVCREAARLAASGDPHSANARANSVILEANDKKMGIIADLRLISVENTASGTDIKTAQLNGGSFNGTATVTTAVTVKSIMLHWFSPGHSYLTFQCKQSFPYTYVFPDSIQNKE